MLEISSQMKFLLELSSIYTQFNKRIDSQLNMHGINFTELMVMHHLSLAENKVMRRVELASAIGLTASGVTRLLNPMEKIHLVEKEKNPRDARVSLVKLTEAGHEMYTNAFLSCTHCAESLTDGITEKQLSTLLELMGKIK